MPRPAVLVIAATDSSGGAGLTRDVRVLSDFSVDALCVVTAVTAQSDREVTAVHHVPPEVIRAQIAGALATREIGAIKIGMLGTRATVEAVVAGLLAGGAGRGSVPGASPLERPLRGVPIVLDPVLVSTSGGILLDADGQAALISTLFPLATLITPNIPETAALLGETIAADEAVLLQQGQRLLTLGPQAILLKGGHPYATRRAVNHATADTVAGPHANPNHAIDLLIYHATIERITSARVAGSSRGTGCALASAIAAGLASGTPLTDACHTAKAYVLGMLH